MKKTHWLCIPTRKWRSPASTSNNRELWQNYQHQTNTPRRRQHLATEAQRKSRNRKHGAVHGDAPINFATQNKKETTPECQCQILHTQPTRIDGNHDTMIRTTRKLTRDERIHELIQEWTEFTTNTGTWRTESNPDEHTEKTKESEKRHSTACFIHKRWSKYINQVQHIGPSLTGVTIGKKVQIADHLSVLFTHGRWNEHVQQVHCELQQQPHRCRMTHKSF